MRNCLVRPAFFQKCETNVVFYLWIDWAALQCSFVCRDSVIDARLTEQVISQKVIRLGEVRVLLCSLLIVSDCFVDVATIIQGHSQTVVCRRITRLNG